MITRGALIAKTQDSSLNKEFTKKGCEIGFGPHLTIDLHSCNEKKLLDLDFIYKKLDELPELIGMHKISSPYVFLQKDNPNTFDRGGVSGFVLIAESHITIHTFPGNMGHVFIDIFSCKGFDYGRAVSYLKDEFEAKKIRKKLFDRGLEFPKDVKSVTEIIIKERESL